MNEDILATLQFMGEELVENSKKAHDTLALFTQSMKDTPFLNQLKQANISIKKLVQDAMKDSYFKQKNIAECIQLDLKDDFMKPIHKDALKYILINMVKNAIDHRQATKVQIALNKSTHSLHIRDNGEGIPAEKLPYIFDLFHARRDSSGIGLALVKHLVESCGGTIQCTSQHSKNPYTVFTISFS